MLGKPWGVVVWVILLYLLQGIWLPLFWTAREQPDWLLVFATLLGFLGGPARGAFAGALSGLLLDVLTGRFLGLQVLTRTLIGYMAGIGAQQIFRENIAVALLNVALASIGYMGFGYLLMVAFGVPLPFGRVTEPLPTFISYNFIAAVLLYPLMLRQSRDLVPARSSSLPR